ncbi:hypothetical protein DK842_16525 [Chromobacterium phragmitis]|uniref:Preprotein translocase subunit SecD n=1 Tax=Chromobacterium phragmitis TaxID=2202141 RepID=A0A344UN97_9NEIS|nr:hypothetical protein [Chromobacterium phragmitis]AXE31364.1 hypothetical protein DK842_16525 [Chromobacterium phragmitis]AXE36745.1 hypothetical protein DK843_22050 [Chromobacterium phragmitis]
MKFLLSAAALLISTAAMAATPAKPVITGNILRLDSACDFTESSLNIQRDNLSLSATLNKLAAARLQQATGDFLNQSMVVVINDVPVSAPVVRTVINTGKVQFALGRDAAAQLLPTLLETTCIRETPAPR